MRSAPFLWRLFLVGAVLQKALMAHWTAHREERRDPRARSKPVFGDAVRPQKKPLSPQHTPPSETRVPPNTDRTRRRARARLGPPFVDGRKSRGTPCVSYIGLQEWGGRKKERRTECTFSTRAPACPRHFTFFLQRRRLSPPCTLLQPPAPARRRPAPSLSGRVGALTEVGRVHRARSGAADAAASGASPARTDGGRDWPPHMPLSSRLSFPQYPFQHQALCRARRPSALPPRLPCSPGVRVACLARQAAHPLLGSRRACKGRRTQTARCETRAPQKASRERRGRRPPCPCLPPPRRQPPAFLFCRARNARLSSAPGALPLSQTRSDLPPAMPLVCVCRPHGGLRPPTAAGGGGASLPVEDP